MLLCASPTSAALASLRHRLPPQKPFVSSNPKPNPNPSPSLIRPSSLHLHKHQTPPKKPPPPPPPHSVFTSDALQTTADEVEDEEEEEEEKQERSRQTLLERSQFDKLVFLLQYGAVLASVEAPTAWAVTGNNNEDDLVTTLISAGVIAFLYFFVAPPIIMNWMRLRWYKRKFLEMFLQFMCVFLFFPGLMLWAPFLNFRKFPRDPTMKYPWSTPKDDVPLYKSR
uniref:NAD(P)H-quinone oxidoreductase subunit L, chloroplastic n=1 Tax=Ananas comosus var. bracteatus TaxID=296719 RepID=A0A6V7P962_ANACO|nr:unnamed protein product [Ananas comosus var. bracteatus]